MIPDDIKALMEARRSVELTLLRVLMKDSREPQLNAYQQGHIDACCTIHANITQMLELRADKTYEEAKDESDH